MLKLVVMKKLYTLLIIALIGFVGNAQIVNIPDAVFKAKLVGMTLSETGGNHVYNLTGGVTIVDINGDGEIQVSEALRISEMQIGGVATIANFQGIEAFANLRVFHILFISGFQTLDEINTLTNLTEVEVTSCPQVVSLNFNSLVNLNSLYLGTNNALRNLYIKNGRDESFIDLTYQFTLPFFICADDSQVASLQSSVAAGVVVNSYCSFTPGGTFYTIQGTTRFDSGNDGCSLSDISVNNLKYNIVNSSVTTPYMTSGSAYSIPVQYGNNTISPVLENPTYFTVSPSNPVISFPSSASPFTQNFCLTANGTHNDLEVSVIPVQQARPGFDASYKIIYKNKGNHTQSGSISLGFDDSVMDFVSSNPSVLSASVNTLNWSFSNLNPFESSEINVVFNLNSPMETPPLYSGAILHYNAAITGLTDDTPTDNAFTLNQTVVNAFDPNDKTCLEGTTISSNMVGQYVHYVVRFENDGTANAQNIVVKDVIDTAKFDITTLIPLSGSAPFTSRIINTNKVEFVFKDINLPFATGTNTGYVAFKIKTKPTLVVGNTFSNSASIFFDYNAPIVTNTYTTTIAALATQDFDFRTYFSVYPNPTKQVLNLETKAAINVNFINIYNMLGQMVIAIPNAESVSTIDVSDLKTGTYFIKVITDKGTANTKFTKE